MDETIDYNGQTYRRVKGKWVDKNNMVVTHLQKTLDNLFYQQQQLDDKTNEELIEEGDKFKEAGTINLAVRNFEFVLQRCDIKEKRYVLPRLMSCYRAQGQPQKAIDIYLHTKKQMIDYLISEPMCVSAAAAYCDLKNYEAAIKCAKRAYALCNGHASGELIEVFKRIDKETK